MLKQVQKGFTLIELMIVVAIIGILAAIAIPAYQDYTIRAQASEGLTMASAAKAAVSEYYADKADWPANAAALGWDPAALPKGKYVSSVTVDGGNIIVAYGGDLVNAAIDDTYVVLRPGFTASGDIVWVCQDGEEPAAADATMAAAPAAPAGLAVTPGKYLPSTCRP